MPPAPVRADAPDRVIDDAAATVTSFFDAVMVPLEAKASLIATEIARSGSGQLTASRVDDIVRPHAMALIDHPTAPVYGAGFIPAADLVADAPSHLAWWQGADRRQLVFPPQSVKQGIDYRELEWFRVPMRTGRSHAAGPYVDYLCSDEYTMTAAAPVVVEGEFVGVAGVDVLIESIERRLTPPLRALGGGPLALVNGLGRVLVATDPRLAAGDTLRGPDLAGRARRPCANAELEIVSLA